MLPDRADMTWEHAEHVARAVNLKMHKEGFKERWCVVLLGAGLSNIGYMKVVERVKP